MSEELQRHRYEPEFTTCFDIFQAAGYRFRLDFDDEVLIESPAELDRDALDKLLRRSLYQIQVRLRSQGRRNLQVFVGGPLAGKPHKGTGRLDGKMFVHIGPRQWACYQHTLVALEGIGYTVSDDPRLYFRGLATSEKNARNGKYIEASR
jgi:hypothetical protein